MGRARWRPATATMAGKRRMARNARARPRGAAARVRQVAAGRGDDMEILDVCPRAADQSIEQAAAQPGFAPPARGRGFGRMIRGEPRRYPRRHSSPRNRSGDPRAPGQAAATRAERDSGRSARWASTRFSRSRGASGARGAGDRRHARACHGAWGCRRPNRAGARVQPRRSETPGAGADADPRTRVRGRASRGRRTGTRPGYSRCARFLPPCRRRFFIVRRGRPSSREGPGLARECLAVRSRPTRGARSPDPSRAISRDGGARFRRVRGGRTRPARRFDGRAAPPFGGLVVLGDAAIQAWVASGAGGDQRGGIDRALLDSSSNR